MTTNLTNGLKIIVFNLYVEIRMLSFVSLAKKTILCSHQRKLDVERHCSNSMHKTIKESQKISFMFASLSSSTSEAVTKAEVLHANFIVQHNISFKTANHSS